MRTLIRWLRIKLAVRRRRRLEVRINPTRRLPLIRASDLYRAQRIEEGAP